MKRILAILVGVAASASALADFTEVRESGETDHITILNYIYGGTFTSSGVGTANNLNASFGARVYTGSGASAGVTLTRVEDFTGSPTGVGDATHLLGIPPSATARDQLWTDGVVSRVSARARYAGLTQQFGWYDDNDNPGFFRQIGVGVPILQNTTQDTVLDTDLDFTGKDWRWGRRNGDGTSPHSSRVSDNDDQAGDDYVRDHMITYYVTGVDGRARWVLFWEDLNTSGADRDYNDLVIELIAIPVPGAALLGALGLGIAGWVKRRMA